MQEKRSIEPAIAALQSITRDLLGLAVRSVDEVGEVSLPQMRLLFAIHDEGQVSCTQLAHVLGLNGSSVTRLADRLVASGHVSRRNGASRAIVELELTTHGHEVIDAVLAWRSRELRRTLSKIHAAALRDLATGLELLHAGLQGRFDDVHGPVPL